MDMGYSTWAFIISLAAVINGLGIVRLLSTMSDYLRKRHKLNVQHYWVFNLLSVFQLMVHVLLWWSLLSVRETGGINFLTYIYLLAGPTLLFLASNFLVPDTDSDPVDMRTEYFSVRRAYYSTSVTFWAWAIFLWPVFIGRFAPTIKLLIPMGLISALLLITDNRKVHAAGVVTLCLLYAVFVAIYAIELGAVGRGMVQG